MSIIFLISTPNNPIVNTNYLYLQKVVHFNLIFTTKVPITAKFFFCLQSEYNFIKRKYHRAIGFASFKLWLVGET